MIDSATVMRLVLSVVALLAALPLVTWRQSRAFEALSELDRLRGEAAVARAERIDLERHVQVLESRVRVVPEARRRLGMHTPEGQELVILMRSTS